MSDDSAHALPAIAASIGVPVARRHIFLCCEQTKPKCCDMERGAAAWIVILANWVFLIVDGR